MHKSQDDLLSTVPLLSGQPSEVQPEPLWVFSPHPQVIRTLLRRLATGEKALRGARETMPRRSCCKSTQRAPFRSQHPRTMPGKPVSSAVGESRDRGLSRACWAPFYHQFHKERPCFKEIRLRVIEPDGRYPLLDSTPTYGQALAHIRAQIAHTYTLKIGLICFSHSFFFKIYLMNIFACQSI